MKLKDFDRMTKIGDLKNKNLETETFLDTDGKHYELDRKGMRYRELHADKDSGLTKAGLWELL